MTFLKDMWESAVRTMKQLISSMSVLEIGFAAWMFACMWGASYVHGTRRMRGVIFNHFNLDRLMKAINGEISMRGKHRVASAFWINFCDEFGYPDDPYRHVSVHGYVTWEIIDLELLREQIQAVLRRLEQSFHLDDVVDRFFVDMGSGAVSAPPRMIPNPAFGTIIRYFPAGHPQAGQPLYDNRVEIINPAYEDFNERLQMTRTWNVMKSQVAEVFRNIPPLFGWLEHRKGTGRYRPLLDADGLPEVDAGGNPIMVLVTARQIWWNNFIECFFILNAFGSFLALWAIKLNRRIDFFIPR